MVNERLIWYLEKNGLLAKQQCGYRSNRSTVVHLVRIETFIRDAFIHNQHLVAAFCSLYVDDFVIMYRSPTIDAIQKEITTYYQQIRKMDPWKRFYHFQE